MMTEYCVYQLWQKKGKKKTFQVIETLIKRCKSMEEAERCIDDLCTHGVNVNDLVVYPRYLI